MSDRLLKESNVLRIAFQLPLVVNSAFADAVKAIPSEDRPTWIPCKERLPKENTEVLISLEWESVDIGWVRNGTWMSDCVNDYEDDVVAWMPLPEPWKGADDEC